MHIAYTHACLLHYATPQDVRALARLLVLREIKLPKIHSTAPNYVFGISSALAARRASEACRRAETEVGDLQTDDSRQA